VRLWDLLSAYVKRKIDCAIRFTMESLCVFQAKIRSCKVEKLLMDFYGAFSPFMERKEVGYVFWELIYEL